MTARYIVPCRSNIFLSKFSLSTSIIHVRFNGIHNNQLFDTLDVVRYRRVMILARIQLMPDEYYSKPDMDI